MRRSLKQDCNEVNEEHGVFRFDWPGLNFFGFINLRLDSIEATLKDSYRISIMSELMSGSHDTADRVSPTR